MRRIIFSVITLLGTWGGYAVGQATPSDTQTLQALLTEVRALRQDVRVSLNRAQTMQILLARFQMQEGVVTRASDRLNEARQKLSDARTNQKEMILHVKQLEDALNSTGSAQEQASLQESIKQGKSELRSQLTLRSSVRLPKCSQSSSYGTSRTNSVRLKPSSVN